MSPFAPYLFNSPPMPMTLSDNPTNNVEKVFQILGRTRNVVRVHPHTSKLKTLRKIIVKSEPHEH